VGGKRRMGKGNGCRYQTAVNLDTCVASSSPRHRNLSNAALEFGVNFDSRTTPHMLPKQRGGCPYSGACRTCDNKIFQLYLINIIYNNAPKHH